MSIFLPDKLANRPYFFDQGLRFGCRQCGDCCVGEPGTIYVSPPEIEAIAAFLHLPVDEFTHQYLYPFKDSYSIDEDAQGRCLLFDDGCAVYDVRPLQCRTFPFWFSNLRSEAQWRRAARQCPGIGRGRLFTKAEILDMINKSIYL
ncbi:MAG: YkgJ family cysteine cluster protein [Desulfobacteraceae bacterium]